MTAGLSSPFENYISFLDKIDVFCREATLVYEKDMSCGKGCSSCCSHFSLFPVEALYIRLAMENSGESTVSRIRDKAMERLHNPDGDCPLLEDGICMLYPYRPIICRTHGLPVLVRMEKGTRVDFCPLNFISGRKPEQAHILDIEQLNTTLSAVNRLFLNTQFQEGEIPERFLLAEALLIDLE